MNQSDPATPPGFSRNGLYEAADKDDSADAKSQWVTVLKAVAIVVVGISTLGWLIG